MDSLNSIGKQIYKYRNHIFFASAVGIGLSLYWLNDDSNNNTCSLSQEASVNNKQETVTLTVSEKKKICDHAQIMQTLRKQFETAGNFLLPTLKKKIINIIDINTAIKQIKELRVKELRFKAQNSSSTKDPSADSITSEQELLQYQEEENTLWIDVKNATFTLAIVNLYTISLLCTLLRIQLALLGREFLQNPLGNFQKDHFSKVIEETFSNLFSEGIVSLSNIISPIVNRVLLPYDVKTNVRFEYIELKSILFSIQREVDSQVSMKTLIQTIILPKLDNNVKSESKVQSFMLQLWDIVESPLFPIVWKESLDFSLQFYLETCKKTIYVNSLTMQSEKNDNQPINMFVDPPLASVLPSLKAITSQLLPDSSTLSKDFGREEGKSRLSEWILQMVHGPLLDSLCLSVLEAEVAQPEK